jgi:hypothetical protein
MSTLDTRTKEELYNDLFLECFKEHNSETIHKWKTLNLISFQHILICSEESNLVAKLFLELQYNSTYSLETRTVNANLDGEYTDVDFFESKLKSGEIGHFEFDMNSYNRNQVYYIMDKVIQPIIETFDVSKIINSKTERKKIVFFKNMDMVLRNTNDDKILRKLINWLEKYIETTNFLFSFQNGSSKIYREIVNYCLRIRINSIKNTPQTNECVEKWILKNYQLDKKIETLRPIHSFLSFRYFMRFLVIEDYYTGLYTLIQELIHSKIDNKNKFINIRNFIIEWLQEGKNHNELIHEITDYICNMPQNQINRYLIDAANRSTYIESSKKIIYHLENLLCTFID